MWLLDRDESLIGITNIFAAASRASRVVLYNLISSTGDEAQYIFGR